MKGKNKKTKKITKQKTKQKKMLRSKQQQQQKIPTKPRGIQESKSTSGVRPHRGSSSPRGRRRVALPGWRCSRDTARRRGRPGGRIWPVGVGRGGSGICPVFPSHPAPQAGVPRVEQAPEKERPADLGYRLLSPGGAGGSSGPAACHSSQVSSLASLNVLPVPQLSNQPPWGPTPNAKG